MAELLLLVARFTFLCDLGAYQRLADLHHGVGGPKAGVSTAALCTRPVRPRAPPSHALVEAFLVLSKTCTPVRTSPQRYGGNMRVAASLHDMFNLR